jgi:hypothetical protein
MTAKERVLVAEVVNSRSKAVVPRALLEKGGIIDPFGERAKKFFRHLLNLRPDQEVRIREVAR